MDTTADLDRTDAPSNDDGFTLIELLIAIVVVGVLSAVAVIGIRSLVDSGESAACTASRDAAQAAIAVYYANHDGTYPAQLQDLSGDELQLNGSANVTGNTMSGKGWSITYTPATNTFSACPATGTSATTLAP